MLRKIINRRIVLALLSILVAGLLSFLVLPKLAAEKTETADVLVFNDHYFKGQRIEESMLSTKEKGTYGHDGLYFEKKDVVGKYLLLDVLHGELVQKHKVSEVPVILDDYLNDLPEDKYAMSVTIQSFSKGLSAKLVANDIISVVKVVEERVVNENSGTKELKGVISPFLEYIKVLSVTYPTAVDAKEDDKRDENEVNENKMPVTITLLVDKKQAQELAEIEENGVLHAVLKYRGLKFEEYVKKQDELNKKIIEFEEDKMKKNMTKNYGISEEKPKDSKNTDENIPNENKKEIKEEPEEKKEDVKGKNENVQDIKKETKENEVEQNGNKE